MFDSSCRYGRLTTLCPSVASISATRRYGFGGTSAVRCLQPRTGSVGFIVIGIRTGAGTLIEVFALINGVTCYLWRAVNHEGEVHETSAAIRRDRWAGLRILKRAMKRYGRQASVVTNRLALYRVAMNVIGNAFARICGRWLNNRAENSHQPFRGGERAMARLRTKRTLQNFSSIHVSVHNHLNCQRHLICRGTFKKIRTVPLAQRRQLAACRPSIAGLAGSIQSV